MIKTRMHFLLLIVVFGTWEAASQNLTHSRESIHENDKVLSALMLTPRGNSLILNDLQDTQRLAVKNYHSSNLSHTQISELIANYSLLYLDAEQLTGIEPSTNRYLDIALKSGKTLMFENTRRANSDTLTALPFMARGDLVIVKPGKSRDKDRIFVYGGEAHGIARVAGSEQGGIHQAMTKAVGNSTELLSSDQELVSNQYAYHDMEKRFAIREHIVATIKQFDEAELSTNNENIADQVSPLNNQTGGNIGYQCPPLAKQERLCWSAIVTNVPYQHIDGNADLNVLHHYSVALYRTDTLTAVAVSTHGSANPNMKVDNSGHRAYYLGKVESTIDVTQTDGLQLWSRNPSNRVNDVSVSSTSGMSFGIDASASDKPSLGASISYDESQSIRVNLRDWESNTSTPDGIDANWIFQLNYPKSISDWVTQKAFKKAKFRDVPGISKYGLQYTTEGIWVGGPEKQGRFEVTMTTKVSNYQLYFTRNTIARWSARRDGWVHTLRDGSYWFNNGWLKRL